MGISLKIVVNRGVYIDWHIDQGNCIPSRVAQSNENDKDELKNEVVDKTLRYNNNGAPCLV